MLWVNILKKAKGTENLADYICDELFVEL